MKNERGMIFDFLRNQILPQSLRERVWRAFFRCCTTLTVPDGEVVFEHVRFTYRGARQVFPDLSLTIRPGEKIGILYPCSIAYRFGAWKRSLAWTPAVGDLSVRVRANTSGGPTRRYS